MVIEDRIKKFTQFRQAHPHLDAYLNKWVADGNK